jgi:hypothetical protein
LECRGGRGRLGAVSRSGRLGRLPGSGACGPQCSAMAARRRSRSYHFGGTVPGRVRVRRSFATAMRDAGGANKSSSARRRRRSGAPGPQNPVVPAMASASTECRRMMPRRQNQLLPSSHARIKRRCRAAERQRKEAERCAWAAGLVEYPVVPARVPARTHVARPAAALAQPLRAADATAGLCCGKYIVGVPRREGPVRRGEPERKVGPPTGLGRLRPAVRGHGG